VRTALRPPEGIELLLIKHSSMGMIGFDSGC
jgi:hypothetical protein